MGVDEQLTPGLDDDVDVLRKLKIKTPAQKDGKFVDFKLMIPISYNTQ